MIVGEALMSGCRSEENKSDCWNLRHNELGFRENPVDPKTGLLIRNFVTGQGDWEMEVAVDGDDSLQTVFYPNGLW